MTTAAFRAVVPEAAAELLERLAEVDRNDLDAVREASADVRRVIEAVAVPAELGVAVTDALGRFGPDTAFAVRSSATAEDLPNASFAGQQDSYLNVRGVAAILDHIKRCWASLYTDRAVIYRRHNGFDDHQIAMAVLVQQLVVPDAAGILFTADPITSNRTVASVEASLGFGEALVSGLVTPDTFQVRTDEIVNRTIARKTLAIRRRDDGGTESRAIDADTQDEPALTDAQVLELVREGRRIEAHFGRPQDIEWCLADGEFAIVQSRPITTLFPVPPTDDGQNHVYISVGHQQMMTDPMKPLGLSFWQLTTPRPMHEAGGRLFVDVAAILGSPSTSAAFVAGFTKSDPLIGSALQAILDRGDFVPTLPEAESRPLPSGLGGSESAGLETDPAIVTELIADNQASLATLAREIRDVTGPALFDFIRTDLVELKRHLFGPVSHQAIMAGMEATWWLNDHLEEWLGEKNAADVLTQSVPHNVTSEMGLALLDVADVIRPHPAVVEFLDHLDDAAFLDELADLPGGPESASAIRSFLDRYGMRCAGEIDITRPRWAEQPATLVPTILSNVRNFSTGAGERRFEQGREQAELKEQELLTRLRELPDGAAKVHQVKEKIDRVRTFAGYREYPKYGMVSRYFLYKQALLAEADRLVQAGVVRARDDTFYLRLDELEQVSRTNHLDQQLIDERREAYRSYLTLTPPRVSTSDGEVITGSYARADLPENALAGLPVSAGTIEGRARVVLDLGQADLEPGDILVTAYTDPSWTPLFVAVSGLVTEVGGAMTHGAVIAREYGLPAVVGVQRATELIRDGQRIRVHGTEGYVELLS